MNKEVVKKIGAAGNGLQKEFSNKEKSRGRGTMVGLGNSWGRKAETYFADSVVMFLAFAHDTTIDISGFYFFF